MSDSHLLSDLLFTYAASSRFRSDVKRWRIFADMSVDIGITLEVAATLFPRPFFLPCICLGNMFKALCGVAAGASGGSINLYWAKGSDISDINAKFGAQHTVTGAIGLVFAGLFAKSVSTVTPHILWLMYCFLTVLHLYANVRCMRLISFDYVNTVRLDMILREYIHADITSETISTPYEIAKKEPLWFRILSLGQLFSRRKKEPSIHFGVAYDEFCKQSGKPIDDLRLEIMKAKSITDDELQSSGAFETLNNRYILSSGMINNSKPCVVVSFFSDVSPEQQTKAYVHARILANVIQERQQKQGITTLDYEVQLELEAEAKSRLQSMWKEFLTSSARAGWDLSRSELRTCGYEVQVV